MSAVDLQLQEAVAAGTVVRASCLCTSWWLAPLDLGAKCEHCGTSMKREKS